MADPKIPSRNLYDWLGEWKASFDHLRQRFRDDSRGFARCFSCTVRRCGGTGKKSKSALERNGSSPSLSGGFSLISSEQTAADKKFAQAERARSGGQNDEARAAYTEALTLFKQVDDRRGRADAQRGLGDLQRGLGRNEEARAAYSEALTLYKQLDDRRGQADAQRGLGDLERGLGRNGEARRRWRGADAL